ncbi:MAG TPA: ATP synthase F1 subunit delta [Chloroflexota bacterium]|nr:ATP synthase F1 subunit delta [Chloroflexota bacterium]
MAAESVARRYARALFELALERDEPLESWLSDLQAIQAAIEDPAVRPVLVSPKLSFERKRELVDRALSGLDPLRRNFVYVLIERGRIDLLGAVVREFRAMMLEHQGVAEATVTTAVPISDAEADRIAALLARLVGRRVILERQVDPSIIGGVVARVGDRLINGSVAESLAALRRQLV